MSANLASLERRLRRLEERRTGEDAVYVAWGRTAAEADAVLRHARDTGIVAHWDEAIALVWRDPTPAPSSRWLVLGREHENELSDRELSLLVDAFEEEAVRREREVAAAKGADLPDLDDTDVRIRILRRESRDLPRDLRFMAIRENPEPVMHWSARGSGLVRACQCPSCLSGETSPQVQYPAHQARFRAWLKRYAPEDELYV
ncbi:hypothetical protein [Methylobacterium longum]|uniref:DUF4838 domain-containing protein n=1 Tax=Methylobacterium longum TaxID=767694 RepID=A0ABT8AT08_9HYPH|nr:hypothetical protein [Methylobacterium longum]MDN3573077.1 hypothetical protein [Methylobacterium longum]GJE12114.1 hypothetical protein FOHLNKBM_3160 [Methylobacterium longum]